MTQRTLLIVDSDVFQQQLIDMLLAVDDYKIITATSARKALELLKTMTPNLCILANNLPDSKGTDLCARIRGVRRFQHVPIILTCAEDDESSIQNLALAVHASLVLAKPLGSKRVRERVRELINGSAPKPELPETFEVSDEDAVLRNAAPSQAAFDTPSDAEASEQVMSQEEFVRSVLARGSVVPLKEENKAKLSLFQDEDTDTMLTEVDTSDAEIEDEVVDDEPNEVATEPATALDEDLLLTEADLTELTIYTDMDIQTHGEPYVFSDDPPLVRPAASFAQNGENMPAPQSIRLENFAGTTDVHVTATRPAKLNPKGEDDAPLVTDTQERAPITNVAAGELVDDELLDIDALLEEKARESRKLIEQSHSVPPQRKLNSRKPEPLETPIDIPADAQTSASVPTPEPAAVNIDDDIANAFPSIQELENQELEQLKAQVKTLLAENDQLKTALRELEHEQPVNNGESYLETVEELEALRRLTEHQSRQLTKLYGENRFLRERQQAPLKPEPPRKTIWDKLKL